MTQPLPQISPKSDQYLTVWEHLAAFRKILFRSLAVFLAAVTIVHIYRNEVITLLLIPLGVSPNDLQFLSPLDPLYFILKIDFIGGFILALPFLLLQLWLYIAPAFTVRRSVVTLFFCVILLLSLGGVLYAYYIVAPIVLSFMSTLVIPGTVVALTAQGYLNFIITTTLILLAIFQLPVIILILNSLHLIKKDTLTKQRRIIYIGILIATAIITPTTDIITLGLVAVPAILAYELGIIFIIITTTMSRHKS